MSFRPVTRSQARQTTGDATQITSFNTNTSASPRSVGGKPSSTNVPKNKGQNRVEWKPSYINVSKNKGKNRGTDIPLVRPAIHEFQEDDSDNQEDNSHSSSEGSGSSSEHEYPLSVEEQVNRNEKLRKERETKEDRYEKRRTDAYFRLNKQPISTSPRHEYPQKNDEGKEAYEEFQSFNQSFVSQTRSPNDSKATGNYSQGKLTFSDDEESEQQMKKFHSRATKSSSYAATKTSPPIIPFTVTKDSGSPQGTCLKFAILMFLSVIVAFCVTFVLQLKYNHRVNEKMITVKAFQEWIGELRSLYPGQSENLWRRSQRMFEKHLNKSHPDEPAIILLTAAQDAEKTLFCVGKQFAKAYSNSRKGNYTMINGVLTKFSNSEEAKLSIDHTLSEGFGNTSKAALLHQIETLPPDSLLILYKYCDHENSAFKDVALVLTVLLPDFTLDPEIKLNALEEKVRDFLKDTFIGTETVKSHDQMDIDKLSGIWSRIAHAVLPVFPESENLGDCGETENKE
ncbi:torsin-1A-interacting protein 1-like isoform X2 [Pelobates fuscus]|uniref:torsin-1A-interacting protein 1-like isoform X2 n=1 Tax=Pelobates fuscus TaxID=191477 RepID=UPI002FE4D676